MPRRATVNIRRTLRTSDVVASMGSTGDAFVNAMAETLPPSEPN